MKPTSPVLPSSGGTYLRDPVTGELTEIGPEDAGRVIAPDPQRADSPASKPARSARNP